MLCGMWDLPGPGLEPVSPALAGGFLATREVPHMVLIYFFPVFFSYAEFFFKHWGNKIYILWYLAFTIISISMSLCTDKGKDSM